MTLPLSFKESNDKFGVCFEEEAIQVDLAFQEKQIIVHSDMEPYDGPYVADPAFNPQTFLTSGKRMLDDFLVNEIRVSKVSNPFGGNTVYIGG